MKKIFGFIKTTIAGGIIFLAPVVVLIMIAEKTYNILHKVSAPLARNLDGETFAGIALHKLLVILFIIFICFLLGLLSRTRLAKKFITGLEDAVLSKIPGYSFIKETGESMVGLNTNTNRKVVIAMFDDNWQISFLIEEMENGYAMVYIPGAPSPWTGSISMMPPGKIKQTDLTYKEALNLIKQLGKGISKFNIQ